MNRIAQIFCIFTLSIALPSISHSVPVDFDGDGVSDRAVVTIDDQQRLNWSFMGGTTGEKVELERRFGKVGVHLVPGKYLSTSQSSAALITEAGNWRIATNADPLTTAYGAEKATYIGGADLDGDGLDEFVFANNRCQKGTAVAQILRNVTSSPETALLNVGKGNHQVTYVDTNGDGRDELCTLKPQGSRRKPRASFTLICSDLFAKRKKRVKVGRVFDTPIPISRNGKPDLLALPKSRKRDTKVRIVSMRGKTVVKKVPFQGSGTLLVGNFIPGFGPDEQLALSRDGSMQVFSPTLRSSGVTDAPDGIPFDEFNINTFDPTLTNCLCSSTTITQNGACRATAQNGCQVQREWEGGGLHKPVSDSTGSIVNLFAPGDRASSCNYLRPDGSVFQEAFLAGFTNPNRPTWRPRNGGSCRSFPKNMIVSCKIRGENHCWDVPNPCQRYE